MTLDIYSHVTPTMGRDAARRLDEVFNDGPAGDGDGAVDRADADGTMPAPES